MGVAECLAFAEAQLGKPYVFGATGPDSYDCSGLAQRACKAGGVSIGRTTYEQILDGIPVAKSALIPGDLVFPDVGHVQIYVGNGMVIEAPHSGAFVREVAMWGFWQARRVFTADVAATQTAFIPAGLPNPLDQFPVLGKLNDIAAKLSSSVFWKRAGVMMLGVLVVLLGVAFVNRKRIGVALEQGAKVAEVAAVA